MSDSSVVLDVMRMAGAGLVGGLFSALIAAKDHRFKKWWELRVAAYQGVIEALSDLAYAFDTHLQAEIEGRELSDERNSQLGELISAAFTRVRKAADSGAFLFSNKANAALLPLLAERNMNHHTYFESIDGMQFAAKLCLKQLVDISKEDLNLRKHWFIWK